MLIVSNIVFTLIVLSIVINETSNQSIKAIQHPISRCFFQSTHTKQRQLGRQGVLYLLDLRRDDGQNFGFDSVEFVETTPSAVHAETHEQLANLLKRGQKGVKRSGGSATGRGKSLDCQKECLD